MTKADIKAGLAADVTAMNSTIQQLQVYHDNAVSLGCPATAAAIQSLLSAVAAPLAEIKGISESDLT